jgi:hypothetical protein
MHAWSLCARVVHVTRDLVKPWTPNPMPHRHNHHDSLKITTKKSSNVRAITSFPSFTRRSPIWGRTEVIGCQRGGARRYRAGHRPAPTPDAIFGNLA